MSKKTVRLTFEEAELIRAMIGATNTSNVETNQRLGRIWTALELTEAEEESRPEYIERDFTSGDRGALIVALANSPHWTIKGWQGIGKAILTRLGWKEPPVQDMEDDE